MKKLNFYLICLICFALPCYLVRFSIFGVPTTLLEILIYISAIITLINRDKLKLKIKDINITWIAIALFLLSGIIGVVVSPEKIVALGQFKALIFDPILFFWVILSNVKTKEQISSLVYAFVLSGIYVGIYSIYQYSTHQFTDDGRIIGLFGYSPNYLAFYLVPLAIMGIFDFLNNLKSREKILNIAEVLSIILSLVAIYLAGSRAAFIAFIGAIVLGYIIRYILQVKLNIFLKSTIAIVALAMFLFVGWQYTKPNFNLSPEDGGRITASNNIRWEIWDTTIKHILSSNNNWVTGVGLGNYQTYFTDLTKDWVNYAVWIAPKALTAHNLWLSTWVNVGIVGLISFITIFVIMLKNIKFTNYLSFGIFIALIAIFIQGMVDTPYWKNDLAVMWWLFAGIIILISAFTFHHEKNH